MKKILLSSLLFLAFVTSCAPAATPTPAPVADDSAISPAVTTIDMFYTLINVAQASEELGLPWNMLTNDAQCNSINKCELTYFQTKWWESKALYRLYSCDPNTVLAEEMLYPREGEPPSAMTGSKYWTYEIVDNSGLLMISKVRAAQAPGSECVLVIDRVANP